jgi:phosphatidylglycerophosphatase A
MTAMALALATAFGVGRAPVAPGTFGSAVGLILWAVLPASALVQALAIALVMIAGVWSAGVAERHYRATDPGVVVIDEVLGMLLALFLNPVGWMGASAAFVLFRFFDVIKPYPANRLERLHGGLGVMCDDAVAGLYANAALRLLILLAPRAA